MDPVFFGGDMIREVTYEKATWADAPSKFEAGTPNIAGAIGLAASIQFIEKIGYDAIWAHERELMEYALGELGKIEGLRIVGLNQVGVLSFTLNRIHPHDIASILDTHNIAVRAGHHCAMPLMRLLGLNGTTRVSFGIYNSKKDVDDLIRGIAKVQTIFIM